MKEDNKDTLPQMDSRSAKNLREAIRQEEMACPPMPSDLNARLMNRVGKEVNMVKPKKSARLIWPWMVAACVAGIIVIFLTPPKATQQAPQSPMGELLVAHVAEDSIKQNEEVMGNEGRSIAEVKPDKAVKQRIKDYTCNKDSALKQNVAHDITDDAESMMDENLHYASMTVNDSPNNYQSPSRMEEFIMKMADYHRVKGERLPYSSSEDDSLTVSTAYVFNDTKELNLFSRLLLAACWYEDTTPGYLLNYSHQQFFFRLEDRHCKTQYLWIAERIRGKILLYSAHAPLDAEMSSDGFREYRNRLSNTSIKF